MTVNHRHRILIFDSGIGGLYISNEIKALMPDISIIYVADNRIYPYGTLSEQALIDRMVSLLPALIKRYHPEAIVIACNSASTLVLGHLRQQTDMPVIGVVPAIKPAAQDSSSQVIGLLATPGTVRRAYTDRLIQDFARHCQIIRVGSHELVDEAEKKLRGNKVNLATVKKVLIPFTRHPEIDRIVLGCTHFPLLKTELSSVLGTRIQLIDSGQAIARRTKYILNALPSHSANLTTSNKSFFVFTKNSDAAHHLIPHLNHHGFDQVDFVEQ